jgi:hypothetical protein
MDDRTEWGRDVARMTEVERQLAVDEPNRAIGLAGDKDDAR